MLQQFKWQMSSVNIGYYAGCHGRKCTLACVHILNVDHKSI